MLIDFCKETRQLCVCRLMKQTRVSKVVQCNGAGGGQPFKPLYNHLSSFIFCYTKWQTRRQIKTLVAPALNLICLKSFKKSGWHSLSRFAIGRITKVNNFCGLSFLSCLPRQQNGCADACWFFTVIVLSCQLIMYISHIIIYYH